MGLIRAKSFFAEGIGCERGGGAQQLLKCPLDRLIFGDTVCPAKSRQPLFKNRWQVDGKAHIAVSLAFFG
ncbi:hypothetical protein THSYN_00615 [Candidatus Thiodictyon syntrophicum]|jgi:hypothetical protein|uniref:Uncharacterized protein n=1 Tax=Candidatus Thiodictyon syntrophicum TaxID=1166950 RepID=A0A2K8U1Z9_9GAMM|nr:hypothetical protein THSYN_00615 [Candidatus Thiodictyon syntrophicum]